MNVNSMIINKFLEFLIRLDLFNFGSSQPDARLCADFAERKSDAGVGSPLYPLAHNGQQNYQLTNVYL